MAPAVVKEEAGQIPGQGVGLTVNPVVGSMKSRCRSLLGLFQAERGWNRMCVHVCVGWGGGGSGSMGPKEDAEVGAGSGGNSSSWQDAGKFLHNTK